MCGAGVFLQRRSPPRGRKPPVCDNDDDADDADDDDDDDDADDDDDDDDDDDADDDDDDDGPAWQNHHQEALVNIFVRRQSNALLAGVVALVLAGCGKHLYTRDDLQLDLTHHHIDLRWGRLENAAQRVAPDLRRAFLASWAQRIGQIEVQDIEVTGMVISEDGNSADVVITLTWIQRDSMAVKVANLPERWVRTDAGWRCNLVAELPAEAPQGLSSSVQ